MMSKIYFFMILCLIAVAGCSGPESEPEKLYFAWYYKPDNTGLPPDLPECKTDTSGWVLFE